jgi:hypothetical protein
MVRVLLVGTKAVTPIMLHTTKVDFHPLQVGEMTQEPIKTQFGYHLILVEGRR